MKLYIIIGILYLTGCKNSLIPDHGIKSLIIYDFSNKTELATIENINTITEFIDIINEGDREPVKFWPKYRLVFKYNQAPDMIILVRGDSFKYKGLTYRGGINIEDIISSKIEAN